MHDIKVCLIYCPIIIKSTYLHQHFLRISTMLFNISSHLSLKKSTSITIELQIQNKTQTNKKRMKASVRLVRFATIGTLNYLITMLVIWIVMSYFSFKGKYIVANIMAYLIAQTHNFIWSKYWIFPSSNPQNSLWQQIMLFCTAFGIAYGIQLLFVILMIEAIGIKEFTAQFIGIIIYGAVNFMVNNRITFR